MQRSLARFTLMALAMAALGLAVAACGDDGDDSATTAATATNTPAAVTNTPTAVSSGSEDVDYYGVRVLPPIPKPDFVLIDQDGRPFDIVDQSEGNVVLLYVGYTHCPDVCPTHLADIAGALSTLPDDVAEQVQVLFVTADPDRDTPEALKRYLAQFDDSFIGLTGEQEDLDNLQRSVGIAPATRTDLGGDNYAVNHAAYVMAYTAEDNLAHIVYPLGFSREQWAHDLARLVTDGWVEDEAAGGES